MTSRRNDRQAPFERFDEPNTRLGHDLRTSFCMALAAVPNDLWTGLALRRYLNYLDLQTIHYALAEHLIVGLLRNYDVKPKRHHWQSAEEVPTEAQGSTPSEQFGPGAAGTGGGLVRRR